jgi:hypothetical protein
MRHPFIIIQNAIMIKSDESITMRAIALCFKPYLKPEEAVIYCNLGRTQLAKKCEEFSIYKTNSGYYKRDDLDRMMAGEQSKILAISKKICA